MDQAAFLAITAMLNSFPQQAVADHEMLLRTYRAVLADSSAQSIIETAQRFTTGKVQGQSKTFAPSVAEFVTEERRIAELQAVLARPRLPAPTYQRGPLAPYQIATQRKWAENAHLPVLFTDIDFNQWKALSAAKDVPAGAKWVAAIGVVFGPAPKPAE